MRDVRRFGDDRTKRGSAHSLRCRAGAGSMFCMGLDVFDLSSMVFSTRAGAGPDWTHNRRKDPDAYVSSAVVLVDVKAIRPTCVLDINKKV